MRIGIALTLAATLGLVASTATAQFSPGIIMPLGPPNTLCLWNTPFSPLPNEFVLHTGITGYERGFLIKYGNYDAVAGNLDYYIEYLADPMDCGGEEFILRLPLHGTDDHAEFEIWEADGDLLGSISADKGSVPVMRDQDDIVISTSVLGPFVINDSMMGQVDRILFYTLSDARILTNLPEPSYYNGAAPTNWLQELFMGLAYAFTVETRFELFEQFRFRRMLTHMTTAAIQRASDAIDDHIFDPGAYASTVWEDHPFVDHSVAFTPMTGSTYGGFCNGHRNYLMEMEDYLFSVSDAERTPFRRIPAWRSEQTVPAAFDVRIDHTTSSQTMPSDYEASNICEAYHPSLFSGATLEQRMENAQDALNADFSPSGGWHGLTHVDLDGDMRDGSTAGRAPIFFPWHTTIDVVWQNWQLCWPTWDPDDYTWY